MLLRHYLRREAGSLLGWSLAMLAVVVPMTAIFRLIMNSDSMQQLNRMLEQMPAALRTFWGGGSISTLDGWMQSEVLGTLVPLLLTVYTALAVLGVLTRETDGRTMDFLLALPVRRSSVLLGRLGGLLLNLAVLHGVVLLSVILGVQLVGGPANWSLYALVVLNQYLIFAALAALLLLVTVFIDDLQKGLLGTLSVALIMFFLPHMLEGSSSVGGIGRLSLFYYYQPQAVLAHGQLPGSDVATLLGALVVATGAAVWQFGRKQLTA